MKKPVVSLEDLGRRIAEARGHMSQRELAARSGIDISTISRIETGALNPTIMTLASIVEALELSLDAVVFGQERVISVEDAPVLRSQFEQFGEEIHQKLRELNEALEHSASHQQGVVKKVKKLL